MKDWWAAISLRGLWVQILLWTILPLTLLLIAFSLTGIRSHQRSMRDLVAERDAGLALALADDVAALLGRYTTGLQVLATAESLDSGDAPMAKAALSEASQRLDGMTLLVINSRGQIAVGPPPPPTWADEAIHRFLTASAVPGEPVVATSADGRILFFGIPVNGGGGWLMGGLPIERLQLDRFLNTGHLSATGAILLVDRERHVLYARGSSATGEMVDDGPGLARALAGESDVRFVPDPRGEQVVAYAPIASTDWALVLREPWEPLAAPLLRFDQVMPFVLLTAAITSLLTLFFGLRHVVRPLQKLGAQADRIGQGDFEAAAEPVGGVKEIEELRRTLDRMACEVQRYQAALENYLGAMTQAQEEERARLARELHDETVQILIALSQRAQMVQRALERDPARAAQRLAELRTMIGEAVEEVRRFSRALRPLYLEELGLVPALEMLAREAGASFQLTGPSRRLVADQELALYRIAQEALSNALRHAQARHIGIGLAFVEGGATLQVRDDGVGFPVPDRFTGLARDGHFGLMGMHERAQLIGGQLTLTSAAGQGTTIKVWLADDLQAAPPYEQNSKSHSENETQTLCR